MRYPDFLKENGTIAYIAPALGCTTEPYSSCLDNAIRKFQKMGYKVVEGPNTRLDKGIGISNAPKLCAEELNRYYMSKDNDVLFTTGGGELMCEIVPYLDFEAISRARPKWFMGYSDNTNFTFLSALLADTASIYGLCGPTFGMDEWHQSLYDHMALLKGEKFKFGNYPAWELEGIKSQENPYAGYNLDHKSSVRAFPEEKTNISGRLIGGCLDCLANLCGTKFDKVTDFAEKYRNDGIIWFMESCDLNIMSVRRSLWTLKNAGWFKYVRGFLFGRPFIYGGEMFGLDYYTAVKDILEEFHVPIIMDLDIGHLPPSMPVVCGAMAQVEYMGGEFSIEYIMN